tara:strand:+ start:4098 stop:5465 length:1368 start_codon:yes stop_codon:yes gene_type:complete
MDVRVGPVGEGLQGIFPPVAIEELYDLLLQYDFDPSLQEDVRPRMLTSVERVVARDYFVPFNLDPILVDHLIECVETQLMRNGGVLIDAQRRVLLQYFGICQPDDLAFAMDRMMACSQVEGYDEVMCLLTALFEYGIVRMHPDYLAYYLMRAQQSLQYGTSVGEVYWMLMYQLDGLSEADALRAYRYQQERVLEDPMMSPWDAYCLGFFNACFVRGEVASNALRWVHTYRARGMFNSNAMIYALFFCQGIADASVEGSVQEYYRLIESGQGLSPAHCYMQVLYEVCGFALNEATEAARKFVFFMSTHSMEFYDAFFRVFYQTHGFPLFFAHCAATWALEYFDRGANLFRAAWYGIFHVMEIDEACLELCFQAFLKTSHQFRWPAWPSFARVMMIFNGVGDLAQGMHDLQVYERGGLLHGRLEALLYVTFKKRYDMHGSELTNYVRQYLGEMSMMI